MIDSISSTVNWYFDPVARIFDAATQTIQTEPGQYAVALAAVLVAVRVVTGYYVGYITLGIADPVVNLSNEARVVVAAVLYGLGAFLLSRLPTTLFAELKAKAGGVVQIYLSNFPDTQIALQDFVWQYGGINPRWLFTVEVLLVMGVIDFLVFRKKGEILDQERTFMLLLGNGLVAAVAYIVAPYIFPMSVTIAFTAKVVMTLAGIYAFTWGVAFLAVGVMRALKAGPRPIFPVRETVSMPGRDKRMVATIIVALVFVMESLPWALLKIGGVMMFLAGGGWKVAKLLTGGVRYEEERCELTQQSDGTAERVCETVTAWDHPLESDEQ